MRVLVFNSGSSSLKFGLLDVAASLNDRTRTTGILTGSVTGIGGQGRLHLRDTESDKTEEVRPIGSHQEAARWICSLVGRRGIEAVGHRVVHGGERFRRPVRLDEGVIEDIARLSELAPLHNPPGLEVIRAARADLPSDLPMVAVFDTSFHATMPPEAAVYALPQELADRHEIRRYGFHGIAHESLMHGYARSAGREWSAIRLITLHLGNGCSAAAIRDGRSVETSMGLTPLEGLVMGTRSGDVDPAVVPYLARRERVSAETVERWLNEKSGLLGVSGVSNDMREVLKAEGRGHARAALAIDLFCHRIRKYIGAYLAILGGADAIVFGGGIGEHAPAVRERICAGMEWCGLKVDAGSNGAAVGLRAGDAACISPKDARLPAFVVAVDEETTIAEATVRCVQSHA